MENEDKINTPLKCTLCEGTDTPVHLQRLLSHPEEFEVYDFLPKGVMTKDQFIHHISSLPDKCLFNTVINNQCIGYSRIGSPNETKEYETKATIKYSYTYSEPVRQIGFISSGIFGYDALKEDDVNNSKEIC